MRSFRVVLLGLLVAPCLPGCPSPVSCPAGYMLNADGRCVAAVDGGTGDGGSAFDAGRGPDGCALLPFYADADGDGHGSTTSSMYACTAPAGYVSSSDDCNDACASCHPGATEVCGNGLDDDCNGTVDDMTATATWYRDADGDMHGDPAMTMTAPACRAPTGYVGVGDDCDDTSAMRAPGVTETCDGVDNDCNDAVDDTFACPLGGMGACTTSCGTMGTGACTAACGAPTTCNPPVETCDGVDQDCDGVIDEGVHAFGPRRDLGTGTSRIAAFAVSPGYLVLYNTSGGIHGQRFDANGAPSGVDVAITTVPAAFGAWVTAGRLVIAWLSSENLQASVFDASTLGVITPTRTILNVGGFATRVQVVANGTGVTFGYHTGTGITFVNRAFPMLTGTSTPLDVDTTTRADFDLGAMGSQGYVAYTDGDDDIEVLGFTVGGAVDYTSHGTLGAGGDPDRAPALFPVDLGGGVRRLGVVWDQHGATTAAKQLRFQIYDVAASGGLTPRDTATLVMNMTSATTTDAAVEDTALDVTWAGGRWVVSALRNATPGTSTWSAFEVTERSGSAPVVGGPVDVEATTSQNVSTSIVAGPGAEVLFSASRTDGIARAYFWACGR